MKEIEKSKLLEFEENVQQQVININGQVKTLEIKSYTLVCPNCKQALMQFQQGVNKSDILKSLASQSWQLNYCINCGQKIEPFVMFDYKEETYDVSEQEREEK